MPTTMPRPFRVNDLPLDILGDIFLATTRVFAPFDPSVPLVRPAHKSANWEPDTPWSLTYVCTTWRDLALSLPALWSHILVRTGMLLRAIPYLWKLLARSKAAPLHVTMYLRVDGRNEKFGHPQELRAFIAALVAQRARWQTVHMCLDASMHKLIPELVPVGDAPAPFSQLVEVRLSGVDLPYSTALDTYFYPAPALRRVIIGYPNCRVNASPTLKLPWSALTTYKSAARVESEHLSRLPLCAASLTVLDLDVHVNKRVLPDADAQTVLPSLRRLVMQSPSLLRNLACPALRELYVCDTTNTTPVLPFLLKSGDAALKLERLSLPSAAASAETLIALLEELPALARLEIEFAEHRRGAELPAQNTLLVFLVSSASTTFLPVPNLAHLCWADLHDLTDRALLVSLVESRSHSLRSIAVYTQRLRLKACGRRMEGVPGLDVVLGGARKWRRNKVDDGWREH